jgi:hypothetical protein
MKGKSRCRAYPENGESGRRRVSMTVETDASLRSWINRSALFLPKPIVAIVGIRRRVVAARRDCIREDVLNRCTALLKLGLQHTSTVAPLRARLAAEQRDPTPRRSLHHLVDGLSGRRLCEKVPPALQSASVGLLGRTLAAEA